MSRRALTEDEFAERMRYIPHLRALWDAAPAWMLQAEQLLRDGAVYAEQCAHPQLAQHMRAVADACPMLIDDADQPDEVQDER